MNEEYVRVLKSLNYDFKEGAIVDASGNYVPYVDYRGVKIESPVSEDTYKQTLLKNKELENEGFIYDTNKRLSKTSQIEVFKTKQNLKKPTTVTFNPNDPLTGLAVTEMYKNGEIVSTDPIQFNKFKTEALQQQDPVAGEIAKTITPLDPNKKETEENIPQDENSFNIDENDPITQLYLSLSKEDRAAIAKGENVAYVQDKLRQFMPGVSDEEIAKIQDKLITKYKGQFTSDDSVSNEKIANFINNKYSAEQQLEHYTELRNKENKSNEEIEKIKKQNQEKTDEAGFFPVDIDSESIKKLEEEKEKIENIQEELRPYYTKYQNKVLIPQIDERIAHANENKKKDIVSHLEKVTGLTLDQLNTKEGTSYTPEDLLNIWEKGGMTYSEMKSLNETEDYSEEVNRRRKIYNLIEGSSFNSEGNIQSGMGIGSGKTLKYWDQVIEDAGELRNQIENYQNKEGYNPFGNVQRSKNSATLGLYEMKRDLNVYSVLQKLDAGEELSNAEKAIFDSEAAMQAYEKLGIKQSDWYEISQGFTETMKFMLGMAMTGGVGGAAKSGVQRILTKAVSNKVKNKLLLRLATSASNAAGFGAGALTQGALMPTTFSDTANMLVGDVETVYNKETGEVERHTPKAIYDKQLNYYNTIIEDLETDLDNAEGNEAEEIKNLIADFEKEKSLLRPQTTPLKAYGSSAINSGISAGIETAVKPLFGALKRITLGGRLTTKGKYIPNQLGNRWATGRFVDNIGKSIDNTSLVKAIKNSRITAGYQNIKPVIEGVAKATGLNNIGSIPEEVVEEVIEQLIPKLEAGGYYSDSYNEGLEELTNLDFYTKTAAITGMLGGSRTVLGNIGAAASGKTKSAYLNYKKQKELENLIKESDSDANIKKHLMKSDLVTYSTMELDTEITKLRTKAKKTEDLEKKAELLRDADLIEETKFYNIAMESYRAGKTKATKRALKVAMKNPNLKEESKANIRNVLSSIETIEDTYEGVSDMYGKDKIIAGLSSIRINKKLAEEANRNFLKSSGDTSVTKEYRDVISKAFETEEPSTIDLTDEKNIQKLDDYINNNKVSPKVIKHHTNNINKDAYLRINEKLQENVNKLADPIYQIQKGKEENVYKRTLKELKDTYGDNPTLEQASNIWDKNIKRVRGLNVSNDRLKRAKKHYLYERYGRVPAIKENVENIKKNIKSEANKIKENNNLTDEEFKEKRDTYNQVVSLLPEKLKSDEKVDTPEESNPEVSDKPQAVKVGNLIPEVDEEFDLMEETPNEREEKEAALTSLLKAYSEKYEAENGDKINFDLLMEDMLVHEFENNTDEKLLGKRIKYLSKIFEEAGLGDSFFEAVAKNISNKIKSNKTEHKSEPTAVTEEIVTKEVNTNEEVKDNKVVDTKAQTKVDPNTVENSSETVNTRVRYKAVDSVATLVEIKDANGKPTGRLKIEYKKSVLPDLNETPLIDIKASIDPDKNLVGEKVKARVITEDEWAEARVILRDKNDIPVVDSKGKPKTITFEEWVIDNKGSMSEDEFMETPEFISRVPIVYVNKNGENIGFVEDVSSINPLTVEDPIYSEEDLQGVDINNLSKSHKEEVNKRKKQALKLRKQILKGKTNFEITYKSVSTGFDIFVKDAEGGFIPPTPLSQSDPNSKLVKFNGDLELLDTENNIVKDNIVNYDENLDNRSKNKVFYLTHVHTNKDGEKMYKMHPVFAKNENNENKVSDEIRQTLELVYAARQVLVDGEKSKHHIDSGYDSVNKISTEDAKKIQKEILSLTDNRLNIENFNQMHTYLMALANYKIDNTPIAKKLADQYPNLDLTEESTMRIAFRDVSELLKKGKAQSRQDKKAKLVLASKLKRDTGGKINLINKKGEVDEFLADLLYNKLTYEFSKYHGNVSYGTSETANIYNALNRKDSVFITAYNTNNKHRNLPVVSVTRDTSGEVSVKKIANNYEEHLKNSFSTNVVSHNIGTEANPKIVTEPQQHIELTPTEKFEDETIDEVVDKKLEEKTIEESKEVKEVKPLIENTKTVDEAIKEGEELLASMGKTLEDKEELVSEGPETSTKKLAAAQSKLPKISVEESGQIRDYIVSLFSKGMSLNEVEEAFKKKVSDEKSTLKIKLKNYNEILETTPSQKLQDIVDILNAEYLKILEVEKFQDVYLEVGKTASEKNNFISNKIDEDTDEVQEKDYSKGSSEDHGIEKVGTALKRIFSRISNKKRGILGVPRFDNFNEMYGVLQNILSNNLNTTTNYQSMISILESYKDIHPWMEGLINELNSSSTDLQTKFVVNMYRHAVRAKTVLFEKKPDGSIASEVWASNSNSAKLKVRKGWKNNFDKSKLTTEGKINVTRLAYLHSQYEKNKKEWSNPNSDKLGELRDWLAEFGITLSDKAFEAMVKGELQVKTRGKLNKVPFTKLFSNNKGFLFGNLASFAKNHKDSKEDIDYISNAKMNPLNDMNNILEELSALEIKYNPTHNSVSRYVGGKSLTEAELPNLFYHQLNKLKKSALGDKKYLNELKGTAFAESSLILDLLLNEPGFTEVFSDVLIDIEALSEMGINTNSLKDVVNLSDYDYDFLVRSLFQHNKALKVDFNIDGIPARVATMPLQTFSDKGRMMATQTAVYDLFSGNYFNENLEFNEMLAEVVYKRLVVPELNRIIETTKKDVPSNIKGYDKNALRFNLMPALNTIKNEKGETTLEYLKDNKEATLEEFKAQFFNSAVKEIQNSFISEAKSNAKNHAEVKGNINTAEYIRKKDHGKNTDLIAELDFIINSNINYMNTMQTMIADPAMFGKNVESENNTIEEQNDISKALGINLGKRLAAMIAPGRVLANSENNSYMQVFLEDDVEIAEGIEELIKLFYGSNSLTPEVKEMLSGKDSKSLSDKFPKLKDYFEIETTDAQEYTTVNEHLYVLLNDGQITKEQHDSIKDKLEKGQELDSKDLEIVFQPIKPVYTGTMIKDGVNRFLYIKSSSFPLLPQITKDNPKLDNLRKSMEGLERRYNTTVRASYQTANKVGALTETINLNDPTSIEKIDSIESKDKYYLELDRVNFKIQQDVPPKEGKVSAGTQIFKLLFGDGVINMSNFNYQGKDISGKELHDEFVDNYSSIINSQRVSLFNELGLEKDGSTTDPEFTLNKFSEILKREATTRDFPSQDIDALTLVKELNLNGSTGVNFKMPMWLLSNSNKFEAMLNSIVANRIFKTKLPGNSFVVGSPNGFNVKNTESILLEDKNLVILQLEGTSEIPDCI